MNIWKAIASIENARRRIYFQYKNKVDNVRVNYSEMDEDSFIDRCNSYGEEIKDREIFMAGMKKWESSVEYKNLLFLLKEDKFVSDLIDVYDAVLESAKENTARTDITSLIDLQNEIKKYRKDMNEYANKDDIFDENEGFELKL